MSSDVTFNKDNLNITLRTKDGESFTTVIKRNSSFTNASLFRTNNASTTLTIKDIIIDGDNIHVTTEGTLVLVSNGTVILESGGVLQNGYASATDTDGEGGGVYITGGTDSHFNMEDGSLITGCTACRNTFYAGGGVCVYNSNGFVMNGGTISHCHAPNAGGGAIGIDHDDYCTINGGLITDCTAGNHGGAIEVHGGLYMNGGTITHCSSATGGAVNFYDDDGDGCVYFSGNPKIYDNTVVIDGVTKECNVDIYNHYHNTHNHKNTAIRILAGTTLGPNAIIGVYSGVQNNVGGTFGSYTIVNDPAHTPANNSTNYPNPSGATTYNWSAFRNDNKGGLLLGTAADATGQGNLIWRAAEPVVRVQRNDNPTWQYFERLMTTTEGIGAFNYVDMMSEEVSAVTIETLYATHAEYTLTTGYTFRKGFAYTLKTIEEAWEGLSGSVAAPDNYSTLIRGYDGVSLLTLNNTSATFNIEKIILDGGYDFATSSGFTYTTDGGLVNVSAGVLNLNDGAILRNSKVDDGRTRGGGIYASGNVSISGEVSISGCTAEYGGGIYTDEDVVLLSVSSLTIDSCFAFADGSGGGIYCKTFYSDLNNDVNVSMANCWAFDQGGGIFASDSVTIKGTIIFDNCRSGQDTRSGFRPGDGYGGGIYTGEVRLGGVISFTNCTVSGYGGGISAYGDVTFLEGSTVEITGCSAVNVNVGYGGGIYAEGDVTFLGSSVEITDCSAVHGGGGIYAVGDVTFLESSTVEITGCSAVKSGGGIYADGDGKVTLNSGVTIENCSATDGSGDGTGGGIYICSSKTLNMSGGSITGCSAGDKGDAIFVEDYGTLNMSGGTITANGTSGSHGAVAVGGSDTRLNFSGSPVIKENGTSGSYKDVLLDIDSDEVIQVIGALTTTAEIGVYVADDDPFNYHGQHGMTFATKPGAIVDNLNAFFSNRGESGKPFMRGTSGATNTLVYWSEYVARVKEGSGDWTYHEYLTNSSGSGTAQGAFDHANTLSGTITVETLLPTHDRYTLTSGFTFNNSCTSLTIQTTQDDVWNPATGDPAVRFRSTITKNQTSTSMIAVNSSVGTLNVEKLVFDGGGDAGCSGTEGGLFYVQSVSATFTDCDFEHSKVNNNMNGGAIAYNNSSGTVRLYGCVFNDCQAPTGVDKGQGNGGAFYTSYGEKVIISKSTARRSRFTSCIAQRYGGAVEFEYNEGQTLLLEHTDFVSCVANDNDGGAVFSDAKSSTESYATTIDDCTFLTCSAQYGGAVITNADTDSFSGSNIISNSTFTGCSANVDGGAVYTNGSSATIEVTGCSFSGCHANSSGGAVYAKNALTITNNGTSMTEFISCSGTNGGAIKVGTDPKGGTLTITNNNTAKTKFTSCSGTKGGAIYVGSMKSVGVSTVIPGTLTIINNDSSTTEFIGCNSTSDGGAIFTDGALSITGSTTNYVVFETCHTTGGNGGAIRQAYGDFSLDYVRFGKRESGVVVDGNIYSYICGGAVHAESNKNNHVNHCEFLGCKTTKVTSASGEGNGGGLRFAAGSASTSMLVENTTFEGCSTYRYGGGLEFEQDAGDITVSNCTFSNCYLQSSGNEKSGGGLYSETPGIISITNCTFNDCHCYNANGGAIGCSRAGTLNLANVNINGHTTGGLAPATVNAKNGAGIYSSGYLTINEGTIKNCTASSNGGGIYVAKTLTVSGLTKIDNNTHGTAKALVLDNVYLDDATNKYVTIDAAGLDCGSHIGITKTTTDGTDINGISYTEIARGTATNCKDAFLNGYFFDDRSQYGVYNLSYGTYTTDKLYFIQSWEGKAPAAVEGAGQDYVASEGYVTDVLTAKGLAYLAMDVNNGTDYTGRTVRLSNDINLAGGYWGPIGRHAMGTCGTPSDAPFTGTFNGQGKVISNMISILPYQDMGLFGLVQGGTITNTFVEGDKMESTFSETGKTVSMGGLVGELVSGTVTYSEAAVTMAESTSAVMGGLVGKATGTSTIHSSMSVPTMSSSHTMGGMVGTMNANSTLANSFANAKFTVSSGTAAGGGLVGENAGTVENCYSRKQDGSTTGSNFGWLASNNTGGTIQYCYAPESSYTVSSMEGTLTGLGTYGDVKGRKEIGYMYDDNAVTLASGVSNSYVDAEITYDGNTHQMTGWPGMLSALNKWVTNNPSGISGLAPWFRPTSQDINGDLPVLGLPGSNSMATLDSDGKFLQYGSTASGANGIDALLDAYSSQTASIFLYGNATGVANVPTANVKVFVNEDACLLQSVDKDFINTTVGITFDNSCRAAYDYYGNQLTYDWHFLSTPLKNAPLGITYTDDNEHTDLDVSALVSGVSNSYMPDGLTDISNWDFYAYHEPSYHWINFKRNGKSHHDINTGAQIQYKATPDADQLKNETNLVPGKGYMTAINQDTYLSNTGTLNRGDVTIKLECEEPLTLEYARGTNLVGNPYQAYLDLEKFMQANGEFDAVYIFDADQGLYLPYYKDASINEFIPSQYIHPHQGFFVITASDNKPVTFNASTMATTVYDDASYYRDRPAYPLVNLLVVDANGNRDLAIVEINRPEAGGARKMKRMHAGNGILYPRWDNTDYQALFTPEGVNEVPVRLEAFEDGVFTMKWSMYNGDFHYAHLIDNLTGADIDLLNASEYKFEASTEDYVSRFMLVFNVTGINEPQTDDDDSSGQGTFAFQFGDELVVTGKGTLLFFDLNGRCLLSTNVEGEQSSVALPKVARGVYLLRLTGSKQTQVQKIIIK
jgi:hypothetical protein